MTYEQPDKLSKFAPRDHPEWIGKLFLIWPLSIDLVTFMNDKGEPEPTEMVTADVAIIDLADPENPNRPWFIEEARIGGKGMVPQLHKKIGKKVLGRLRQSPAQGQKSGAYFIEDWTPADAQIAEQYEAAFPHSTFQQPSGNGQAPAAAQPLPWQQSQAAPQQPVWQAQPQAVPQAQPWQQAAPPAAEQTAWGPPQAAQPQAQPAWADGLREFLESRGIQTSNLDENTARQIAATFQ